MPATRHFKPALSTLHAVLTLCAAAVLALCAAAMLGAVPALASAPGALGATHRAPGCRQRRGHTLARRGEVRVYRVSGVVYGCLLGSTHAVMLWELGAQAGGGPPETSGTVKQQQGAFIAVETISGNQYGGSQAVQVFDLENGASYTVAYEESPISGAVSADPPTGGTWPLQAFSLGPDGRVARLYDTLAPATMPGSGETVTAQTLDVIGFHGFQLKLASTPPEAIVPSSLVDRGSTVTWTQEGTPHSAGV
ncbi:MAG TPA: hypothetical protein VK765_00015 [Solirubrobacteraceae bacterium]|jgi:hypothetical protein|nr:hypothetical protein [Solirubrobacteraceae bacterium]